MKRIGWIGAAGLAFAGGIAAAQDTNTEIVVMASRSYREAHRIPGNVSVLTAADIERGGYPSLVDALQEAGGITFRSWSGNPSQAEIQMRGFGENSYGRVLVLLDGQKLNRPDMAGMNWLQVPLRNVERVEILRGGETVLHGDHAVAGTVNIVTRKGSREPEGSVAASVGSFGLNIERADYSASAGRVSYAVNAEHQGANGYRDRSAFEGWSAGGRMSWDIQERWNAALGLSYDTLDFEMPGGLTLEEMDENRRRSVKPGDEAAHTAYRAHFSLTGEFGGRQTAGLDVSFRRQDVRSDTPSYPSFFDMTIDTFGITPRCVLTGAFLGREHRLLAGMDYGVDRLAIRRFSDAGRGTETSSAAVRKMTAGAYAQDEAALAAGWTLTAGARAERAAYDASMVQDGRELFDQEKKHARTAFDLTLARLFGDKSKVFARIGSLYRYPFADEQVSYFGFGGDGVNTNLAAETGTQAEVGAEVGIAAGLRAGLTLFWLNMDREIAFNGATFQNENLDATRHRGAEASLRWAFARAGRLDANLTLTDAAFTGGPHDGKDIPLVPAHSASVAATFGLPYDLSVRAAARTVGPMRLGGDYENADPRLPAYAVADLLLRYTPAAADGLDAFVAVDNVFGEKYASVGYKGWSQNAYYPAPERTFRAGVSYRY